MLSHQPYNVEAQPLILGLWRIFMVLFSSACLFSVCNKAKAEQHTKLPNIVLIYADDLGYGDLSCYGATKIKTPNIDRLAKEGRKFTDAHSASAVCTPSRYSLLTGQYAWRKDIWGPLGRDRPLIIETKRMTLQRLLSNEGYTTACIGKWHLGFGKDDYTDWNKPLKPGPLETGFDYYFGIPLVNSSPPYVYVENHHVVGLDPEDPFVERVPRTGRRIVFENAPPPSPVRPFPEKGAIDIWAGAKRAHKLYDDEMVGTTLAKKSTDWIRKTVKQNSESPFFLYLATTNIHHPFTPHQRFKDTSECGRYGDFIHELDWIVGEVMSTLDNLNEADNTLLIFTSDNGGMFNGGGREAWDAGHYMNGTLLGWKFGAWEGGHRVPLIIRWPEHVPAGTQSDQLISSVDLLATIASLIGRDLNNDDGPDSFNMLPAITGKPIEPIRDHLVISPFRETHLSLREGPWMFIGDQGSGGFGKPREGGKAGGPQALGLAKRNINSDITFDGKVKEDAPLQQLYNLKTDRNQEYNIAREYQEIAKKMKQRLEDIKKSPRSAPIAP